MTGVVQNERWLAPTIQYLTVRVAPSAQCLPWLDVKGNCNCFGSKLEERFSGRFVANSGPFSQTTFKGQNEKRGLRIKDYVKFIQYFGWYTPNKRKIAISESELLGATSAWPSCMTSCTNLKMLSSLIVSLRNEISNLLTRFKTSVVRSGLPPFHERRKDWPATVWSFDEFVFHSN